MHVDMYTDSMHVGMYTDSMHVAMYTECMNVDVTPCRAVFIFPVMKQNIYGHKFEDGDWGEKIVTGRLVGSRQTDIGREGNNSTLGVANTSVVREIKWKGNGSAEQLQLTCSW